MTKKILSTDEELQKKTSQVSSLEQQLAQARKERRALQMRQKREADRKLKAERMKEVKRIEETYSTFTVNALMLNESLHSKEAIHQLALSLTKLLYSATDAETKKQSFSMIEEAMLAQLALIQQQKQS